MAVVNKQVLKSYFEQGDIPTQGQYVNLIDSTFNLSETGAQIIEGTLQVAVAEIDVLDLKKAHLPGIGISSNVDESLRTGAKVGSSFRIGKSLEVVGTASLDYLLVTGGAISASNGIIANDITSSKHISGSKLINTRQQFIHHGTIAADDGSITGMSIEKGFTIGPALVITGNISSSGDVSLSQELFVGKSISSSRITSSFINLPFDRDPANGDGGCIMFGTGSRSDNGTGYVFHDGTNLILGHSDTDIVSINGVSGNENVQISTKTTINGIADITDTTDATDASGDTGALRTEGGASIAKKLYVGSSTDIQGTLTVGVDDTGYDVEFFGATAGQSLKWDESAGGGTLQLNGIQKNGVDGTGYDVKFYGATSGKNMHWDASDDQLDIAGSLTVDDEIKGEFNRPYQTVTGDQTLAIGHGGQYLRWTHTGDNSMKCTVPPNSSVAYNLGTEIEIFQTVATGHIKLIAGSGVTLNSRHSLVSSSGQFSAISLKKVGTDEWDVIGDLTA
jgi:hypothetical protein